MGTAKSDGATLAMCLSSENSGTEALANSGVKEVLYKEGNIFGLTTSQKALINIGAKSIELQGKYKINYFRI